MGVLTMPFGSMRRPTWSIPSYAMARPLVVLLFVAAYLCFSVPHLFQVYEEVISEYASISAEVIGHDALEAERLLIKPVSENVGVYFETLRFVQTAERRCKALSYRDHVGDEPANAACLRLRSNLSFWMRSFFDSYRSAFSLEVLSAAKEENARTHPVIGADGELLEGVRWDWDEALLFYGYGLMISAVWLVVRLFEKKFRVFLEVCMPRFGLALCLWPFSIWFYPGDPRRQLRDLLRVLSMLLSAAISCFSFAVKAAPAGSKKPLGETDSAQWNLTGYLQGIAYEGLYDNQANLFLKGELAQGWRATLEVGITRSDWADDRMLKEASLEKEIPGGALKFGWFTPVSGWTTPPPFALETVWYPHANPWRGGAFGIQWNHRIGNAFSAYLAVTGTSGRTFTEPENWDGIEWAGRLEHNASPWSWAITGQVRPDAAWSSAEFRYRPTDENWRMKGVFYGGTREGETFASGYVFASYAFTERAEAHLMVDHGKDRRDCVTVGATFRPLGDRDFSITLDKDFVLNGGSDDIMVRFRFGF